LSWHPELSLFVLSVWRGEVCLASFQLMPADAARLVGELTDVLATGFPVDAPLNTETA
jgi:hypothetical protein